MAAQTSFLTIKEVHLYMLNIFDDILSYLNENDVPYVLTGGSALGAVRHRGFIPWDDDIDLAIPRDAYNEFLENYKPKDPDFSVISVYDSDNSDISYMRVVNDKTASSNKFLNVNNGIFVDVFPIDHVPDSKIGQKLAYYRIKYLDLLRNSTRRVAYKKSEAGWRNFSKKALAALIGNKPISRYANKMNKFALKTNQKNQNSDVMTLLVVQGINGTRENAPAATYTTERTKAIFEGREVYVPGPGYLETQFTEGYMQIPRKHKSHGKFYFMNEKHHGMSLLEGRERELDSDVTDDSDSDTDE